MGFFLLKGSAVRRSTKLQQDFSKKEIMTRCVYGFSNFENYRLRVLAHCGWNGIINRPICMPYPVNGVEPQEAVAPIIEMIGYDICE